MDEHAPGVVAYSEQAFRRVYDETLAEALRVSRGICVDEEDAKEACQDAYLALHRYWSTGRLHEPPRHLLFRALQRSAVDRLRSRSRRARLHGYGDLAVPMPGARRGALARALRRLRPEDAALLVAQAIVGMSYDELAAVQRTSAAAVKARLVRIRRALRERYAEEGGER